MKLNIQIMSVFIFFLIFSCINSVENYSDQSYIRYNNLTGEITDSQGNCRRNCMGSRRSNRPGGRFSFSNPFKNFKMPNFSNMFKKAFSFCTGGSTKGALCTFVGGKLFGVDFSQILIIGVVIVIIYFVVLK